MHRNDYKNLNVWKHSIDLTIDTYTIIRNFPPEERYALGDQMRRSAVSVPSNIAEGAGRNSDKEFLHFISIANGSLCELETQCILGNKIGLIGNDVYDNLISKIRSIAKMLNSLSNYLKKDK